MLNHIDNYMFVLEPYSQQQYWYRLFPCVDTTQDESTDTVPPE